MHLCITVAAESTVMINKLDTISKEYLMRININNYKTMLIGRYQSKYTVINILGYV